MIESRRLACLQAMGITVWRSRAAPAPAAETVAEAVTHPDDWSALAEQVAACRSCPLAGSRTQAVFGKGSETADWLLVGEAPGQQEDLQGQPFVGPAGKLLDEMLKAAGLAPESVYIANILKCRPPDNRNPKPEEAEACRSFLNRQIALLQPRLILALGKVAAQNLLGNDKPLGQLRQQRFYLDSQTGRLPVIVSYHPAYLLRRLADKRKAWDDLQFALKTYQSL